MSTFSGYPENKNHFEKNSQQKRSSFWLVYGEKMIIILALVLVAGIAYQAGLLHGKKNQTDPVEVFQADCQAETSLQDKETTALETCPPCAEKNELSDSASAQSESTSKSNSMTTEENQKCAFVASKNSNKFHLPTCAYAQKIKPENRVCFSSKEEAQSRGYQAAKCCIK